MAAFAFARVSGRAPRRMRELTWLSYQPLGLLHSSATVGTRITRTLSIAGHCGNPNVALAAQTSSERVEGGYAGCSFS